MADSQASQVLGRIRWKRFGILVVPAVFVVGGIVLGMANGAIAASFSVSGQQFKVSADQLNGTGFKQFGGIDTTNSGTQIPVATATIDSATLTNLCQSVSVPGLPVKVVLRIEAGTGSTPVNAKNLVIGAQSLQGNATFTNIQIGRDGADLSGDPALKGTFGQSADSVTITGLKQVATSTSAGTFELNGLNLRILTGDQAQECF
jgi:Family of unknown function (DUF6230)